MSFRLFFFFQISLFRELKILGYLYFEGRLKVVLKNVIIAKTLVRTLVKLVYIFLKSRVSLFQGF